MPQRIENYLTDGLPAKIYLCAYLEPQTGYSIAKRVHVNGAGERLSARIYEWIGKMIKDGYLVRKKIPMPNQDSLQKDLVFSSDDKLVAEIREALTGRFANVNRSDLDVLSAMICSRSFKTIAGKAFERALWKENDCVVLVSNILSSLAAAAIFLAEGTRKTDFSNEQDKAKLGSDFDRICRRISQKSYHRYLEDNDLEHDSFSEALSGISLFVMPGFSRDFIKQLSQLSPSAYCLQNIFEMRASKRDN